MVEEGRDIALKRVQGRESVMCELSGIRGALRHYLVCSVP
jgi:hypothetical protein